MAESKRDFVKIAKDYARSAIRDKARKRHGLLIQQASQRFLDDLKRSRTKACAFKFDAWHANDVCDFIEKLPHAEGTWDTPNIVLHKSHVFFLVQLFGFRSKTSYFVEDYGNFNPRRYTSALFAVARKNAKSTLASGIMLYCECCEPEQGAQVISAGTTFPQSSIIFNTSKRMVEKTPALREAFGLEIWAKSITRVETGASYKPIHAKASTQDGLNPSHVALDEIHAHKTGDLLNVLTSAAGARKNPLWLYTTTEGYTNPGPWGELRQFAKKLLSGIFGHEVDHFLAVFYALDEENKALGIKADKEGTRSAWIKANPLIDVIPSLLTAIEKEFTEAKQMPSKMAEFKIKRLNRPASVGGGWVDLAKFSQCSGAIDLEWLADKPCVAALDLASTSDLASFRITWRIDGHAYTIGFRWCPADAVAQRTERGTVPYQSWVEQGLIVETEGNTIDYEVIEKDIVELYERFNITTIGYDKWNATDIVMRLVVRGLPMIEFVQGTQSFHPAMQNLEIAYTKGELSHGGDLVLNWCASNLVARRDVNLNMAPDKRKSSDKIDDFVTLIMTFGLLGAAPVKRKSIYEQGTI